MTHRRRRLWLAATCSPVLALMLAAGLASPAVAAPAQVRSATAPSVLVRNIAVGTHASTVAVDPVRRAVWVGALTATGPQLVRISEATQKVTARIGIAASAVAVDPGTGTVWALNSASRSIAEVSETTNKVVRRIGGFGPVRGLAVDPRTRTVWLTSAPFAVQLSEATHRVLHQVRLNLNRFQQPGDVAIDPRTGTVWVGIIPSTRHTPSLWITEISEAAHRIVHTYPYGMAGDVDVALAVDSARGTVWVASNNYAVTSTAGMLQVIRIADRRIVRTFTAPVAPLGMAIDSRTHTVLATGVDNHFLVLNELTHAIIHQVKMGFFPGDAGVDAGTGNVYVPIVFKGVVAQFHE